MDTNNISAGITKPISGTNSTALYSLYAPEYKSVLEITPELYFYQTRNKPSRWIRFWQKFLLGWTWRDA